MKTPDQFTHRPYATPPAQFRAVATGIGASVKESMMTGMARDAHIAAGSPTHCMPKLPVSRGY
jgi:hypothetical protein